MPKSEFLTNLQTGVSTASRTVKLANDRATLSALKDVVQRQQELLKECLAAIKEYKAYRSQVDTLTAGLRK